MVGIGVRQAADRELNRFAFIRVRSFALEDDSVRGEAHFACALAAARSGSLASSLVITVAFLGARSAPAVAIVIGLVVLEKAAPSAASCRCAGGVATTTT